MAETVCSWREMKSFTMQVLASRWFMIFACLLIMSFSGTGYLFSLYSNELKQTLGYDQTTLNLISFFREFGGNFGLVTCILNVFLPPWAIILMAAAHNFFGFFMMWLSITGQIAEPHVWQMCLYMGIAANIQTYVVTGIMVTATKSFPQSTGLVLGLVLGYLGLSGAIFPQIYRALYEEDAKSLLLLAALALPIVSIPFLPKIRYMELTPQPNEARICYRMLCISICLAGFLMTTIIIQTKIRFNRVYHILNLSVLSVILVLPLAIVIREEYNLRKSIEIAVNEPFGEVIEIQHMDEQGTPIMADESPVPKTTSSRLIRMFKAPERGEDHTLMQAICSLDLALLLIVVACGIGGTSGAIDNLGQISSALGYSKSSRTTFVSLMSIWNFFGRVTASFGSEYALRVYKFPRTLALTLILVLACVSHLLIAFSIPNSIYLASVISGFCLGGIWPLFFNIIPDLFGLKNYATILNFSTLASPVGCYFLNVKVIGHLYDKEAMRQMKDIGVKRKHGQSITCTGKKCYRLSFIIVTIVTVIGVLASVLLAIRTRKFYAGETSKKEAEVVQTELARNGNKFSTEEDARRDSN